MNSRLRLSILLSAALVLWFARDALLPAGAVEAPASRSGRPARPAAPVRNVEAAAGEICTVPGSLPARGELAPAPAFDPFTAWQSPDKKAATAKTAALASMATPVFAPPPPPPPATVPYRYLGALNEMGVAPSVFLSLGNTLITAKAGDTLEGGFRLQTISPRELTFVHLQQNHTVRLGVEGEPP